MSSTSKASASKKFLVAIGAVCALLMAAACTSPAPSTDRPEPSAASDSRLATINESGTLKVCTSGDYHPFTYLDPETGDW